MTTRVKVLPALLLIVLAAAGSVAEEVRVVPAQADQKRVQLIKKAAAEKAAAEKEAVATEAAVRRDRAALEKAVAELEAKKSQLAGEIASLEKEDKASAGEESRLDAQLLESSGMMKELVGQIRINAKDLDELIRQSPQYVLSHADEGGEGDGLSFLTAVAGDEKFPGMKDIRTMVDALAENIRRFGEVNLQSAVIINRQGRESRAEVLLVGPFIAAYSEGEESGFLHFTPGSEKLYALANLPDSSTGRQLASYMAGQSPAAPVDISRGGALRQISHRVDFVDQIRQGGPIVYPILALLVFGLLIVVERGICLLRSRQAKPPLISLLRDLATEGKWQECDALCASHRWRKKPMGRVLKSGLSVRTRSREDIENALHEAILAEVPRLERGLSTLGMFTSIAPLLGLLGTVTGMINVFHVITLYGAGDPRMMSSGISEALVTTMLGLSAAIPLMLLHNVISRGVDRIVDDMEEQSVSLVNLILKLRGDGAL